MAATLKRVGDDLHLSLKGHADFRYALEQAKRIFPRRWDGDLKVWVYPASESTALKIMYSVGPQPDADVLAWVRGAAERIADDLAAQLPQDAELYWVEGPRLFQFQRPAVDFMARQERVLNGDDMGLGKTIEAIGGVQEWLERERSRTSIPVAGLPAVSDLRLPKLVMVGTSKIGDWHNEIKAWTGGEWDPEAEQWTGGDHVMMVPGDMVKGKREAALADFESGIAHEGGWLVVNAEQTRAVPEDKDKRARDQNWTLKNPWFAEREWLAGIYDEAHRAKNPFTQTTRGLWQIDAHLRYALTGTPIVNAPPDLWGILAWLKPDEYNERGGSATTYWQFLNRYAEGYNVPGRSRVITGVKNGDDLRMELADVMIRRSKRLLVELGLLPKKLPTKTRIVKMHKNQAKLYRETENAFWLTVEQDVERLREKAAAGDNEASGALERAEAAAAAGQVAQIAKWLPNAGVKYSYLRQIATSPGLLGAKDESGKLDAVIEDILDAGDKQFVAFTWHRETAELVAARLNKKKVVAEWMHGGTKYLERTALVERFESGKTQVLVSSIKTGGEGLNLVNTDMPLFVELSDAVGNNDQAEDRTWRIGQKEEVQPVRYLTDGTVEVDRQEPRLRMKEIMLGATIGRDR